MNTYQNTMFGVEKFTFFISLPWRETNGLLNDFRAYRKIDKHLKEPQPMGERKTFQMIDGTPYQVHTLHRIAYDDSVVRGVRWTLKRNDCNNDSIIEATINPRKLLGENHTSPASDGSYFDRIVEAYNSLAVKISPLLRDFKCYKTKGVVPCISFDLEELGYPCSVEQMMYLITQGDIPGGYEDRYSHTEGCKNRFYLEPKTKSGKEGRLTISCYSKYQQLSKESSDHHRLETSKNLINFEVECKYSKVYSDLRKLAETKILYNKSSEYVIMSNPISEFEITRELLSDHMSKYVLLNEFNRTIMGGDFHTLENAVEIIDSIKTCSSRRALMTWALELVKDCHGVYNAKQRFENEREEAIKSGDKEAAQRALLDSSRLYRALGHLKNNDISPVTIPIEWNISYMPGLLKAYQAFTNPHNLK